VSKVTLANPVTVVEVSDTAARVITQTSFGYYGSFICTLGFQPDSTTTAFPVGYNTPLRTNGVTVEDFNKITFAHAGVYRLNWELQFRNTDAAAPHDARVWVRKNGQDVTSSTAVSFVPQRRGATNGHTIVCWSWVLDIAAGDYAQLMLAVDSTQVSLHVFPAGTNPPSPVSPCTSLFVEQVGY
jgi:hypothetical protein